MVVFTVQRAFVAPGITEPRYAWNMLSPSISLLSPGGVVAIENPIRWGGGGYQGNENPKSRLCFGLRL